MRSVGRKSISASATPRALMEEKVLANVWTARVLTLYPEMFPGPLGQSLTGRALKDGLWQLALTNIREHGLGKHRAVDDTPTGGGAGMVLRPDVLDAAIRAAPVTGPLLYLSPRGQRFDQAMARELAAGPGVTLLCGRFEGVDERVIEAHGIIEVSLGDFVLTGGEIPAMALIDATVRLLPNVLGNAASTEEESFSHGLLEHPQYTRPNDWEGRKVPDILLSGHHAAIEAWRREQAEEITRARRPDLWADYQARKDAKG
ncbi:tRNA (guanosine(37)-N1)-methyltransferase TrmD [Pontivivens ytuae]|uniref:tRNA (guanine-N(1)-)-methyltransferase n=1 Tax=Pontivivens ytuae TaxID=2789856 RepID=A0A7S9LWS9_9RHOB|nr:tRNA (guanosine(37)-N1)-methyltransferase TrmD [Pontivivens ytuae]QPH56220.1 tRNA (guanosine(37)-N1)-methyltransferase TrmD [Pontivivens ytuae]